MASRVKKLFNRKKDDESAEQQPRARAPTSSHNDPAMRTSLYDSTVPAGLPQTGDYPIKGNDSSIILQAGRKSSIRSLRSRRSSSRGSQYNTPYSPPPNQYDGSQEMPRGSSKPTYAPGSALNNPHQDPAVRSSGQDDGRKRWSRSPLPQEFAGLSLGDSQSPTTVTSTVTTTTHTPHQAPQTNRAVPQVPSKSNNELGSRFGPGNVSTQDSYAARGGSSTNDYGTRRNVEPRVVNQLDGAHSLRSNAYRDNPTYKPKPPVHQTADRQKEYDAGPARQKSIPRKQVGTSSQAPYMPPEDPFDSPEIGHHRQQNASKALPSIPPSTNNNFGVTRAEPVSQPASILNRSRPVTRAQSEPLNAQDVVSRAKSNTYDTEVIEKVAPAVVHENVTKDVHHIREEVITREIHTHDVFHRILPVVDVEVLPPRHFLPVEGGGLVEVSASEVPGRGRNWVIAETASKIPSDQAAPREVRRFTAREFPGKEGDSASYIGPEGQAVTEQTWIHPPELEQGARLTGQSWPMTFGSDSVEGERLDGTNSKSPKRKGPKKGSSMQANPAPNAGGLFR